VLHALEGERGPADGQLEDVRALPILGVVAGVGRFGRHRCLPFVREPLEPFMRGIGRSQASLDRAA
jgi:hypothetical protein